MGGKASLPQDKVDRILALHAQGAKRNEIARQVGVGPATVSKYVEQAGGGFDRTATATATQAKQTDARARRADIASRLLTEATALLDEMHRPHTAFSFGGRDNVYTERQMDAPPVEAKRHLMMAASTALQRHMDLDRHDAEQKAEAARSMLAQLAEAFGVQQPDA